MDIKPRFKIGDKVTYKSMALCYKGNVLGQYYYGGYDQGGYVGEIKSIGPYTSDVMCFHMDVTCKDGGRYSMIESEFVEYDKPLKPKNGYFFEMVVNRRKRLNSLGLKPKHIKKYH